MQNLSGGLIAPQTVEEVTRQLESWSSGIDNEIDWWNDWFRTGGDEWPEDFKDRLKPDSEWPADRLPVPKADWKILDVGAGPATKLPQMTDGKRLDITATDPLAPFYKEGRARVGYVPPIETTQAFAEDLTAVFEPDTFDLVNIENALDHSRDPLRGIEEMLIVAKVGGAVVLRHAIDEAKRGAYEGLHQWNFNSRDGKFIIWNLHGETVVDPLFASVARFETDFRPEANFIRTIIWKEADIPIDLSRRRKERLQTVLSASLVAMQRMGARRAANVVELKPERPEPKGIFDRLRKSLAR